MKIIDALNISCYRNLNNIIDKPVLIETKHIILKNVCGQRYIGRGLSNDIKIEIHGTPGNDMAAYMDGAQLEIFGNAQDSVGNTMNNGRIIIHGNCGDTVGYAMRGGEIYVEHNVGYRVGIHMKEYKDKIPVIVIGGQAGAFLGEYMAGGAIIVLGLNVNNIDDNIVGEFCGTGIHGGVIYLNHTNSYNKNLFGKEILQSKIDERDKSFLKKYIDSYKQFFNMNLNIELNNFKKYIAIGKNPYSNMYCNY
jgi:glutamate synthase domain-containing protein 3